MDTVATMTSKQIKSKCNTEIHEHIRHQNLVTKILSYGSHDNDKHFLRHFAEVATFSSHSLSILVRLRICSQM